MLLLAVIAYLHSNTIKIFHYARNLVGLSKPCNNGGARDRPDRRGAAFPDGGGQAKASMPSYIYTNMPAV